jgi:hypothetical protein
MPGTFAAFNLLWGSVDADNPLNYNLLSFTFLGAGNVVETITGSQIISAAGGAPPVVPGTSNIAAFLTDLPACRKTLQSRAPRVPESLPVAPPRDWKAEPEGRPDWRKRCRKTLQFGAMLRLMSGQAWI